MMLCKYNKDSNNTVAARDILKDCNVRLLLTIIYTSDFGNCKYFVLRNTQNSQDNQNVHLRPKQGSMLTTVTSRPLM